MNSEFSNALSVVTFFAVGFGLLKLINRFEPQWVSKDGLRFTAKISLDSASTDKWTEIRVLVDGNEIIISGRGRKARALMGKWTLSYSADAQDARTLPHRGREPGLRLWFNQDGARPGGSHAHRVCGPQRVDG